MALQHEDASSISFARSPILYALYESTYAHAGFYYTCDVYVWQGTVGSKPASPNYELKKFPSTNGTATFNVQSFAQDYFPTAQYTHSAVGDTDEMYCWLSVDLNWTDDAGSGTAVEVDPIIVYNGYNYYLEGVNYLTSTHLGNSAANSFVLRVATDLGTVESIGCLPDELIGNRSTGYFMTDRPLETDISSNTSMYIYLIKDTTSLVTDVIINVNDGEEYLTYPIDSLIYECAAIGVGSTEVTDEASVTPTTWDVYGADDLGNIITQVYTYTIVDTSKWGIRNLRFTNRYGVWDNLLVRGRQDVAMNLDRTEIMNNLLSVRTTPSMSYDEERGQFQMMVGSGRYDLIVNTGWLTEDWNSVIEQLMLSEAVYDADTLSPFTIKDKSIQYKYSLNDKMINYTIKLQSANTVINTVV